MKDHSVGQQSLCLRIQGRPGRVMGYSAERSESRPGCWSLGRVTLPVGDFSPFVLVVKMDLLWDLELIPALIIVVRLLSALLGDVSEVLWIFSILRLKVSRVPAYSGNWFCMIDLVAR